MTALRNVGWLLLGIALLVAFTVGPELIRSGIEKLGGSLWWLWTIVAMAILGTSGAYLLLRRR